MIRDRNEWLRAANESDCSASASVDFGALNESVTIA